MTRLIPSQTSIHLLSEQNDRCIAEISASEFIKYSLRVFVNDLFMKIISYIVKNHLLDDFQYRVNSYMFRTI